MAAAGAAGAAAAAAEAAPNLAASYAAVQSNLRKQFFGDLVELRGALINTLNLEPQRSSNLHLKLQLIDTALHMLEESRPVVSHVEMAQLMNMSAKVVRAVEAWRARKVRAPPRARACRAGLKGRRPPRLTLLPAPAPSPRARSRRHRRRRRCPWATGRCTGRHRLHRRRCRQTWRAPAWRPLLPHPRCSTRASSRWTRALRPRPPLRGQPGRGPTPSRPVAAARPRTAAAQAARRLLVVAAASQSQPRMQIKTRRPPGLALTSLTSCQASCRAQQTASRPSAPVRAPGACAPAPCRRAATAAAAHRLSASTAARRASRPHLARTRCLPPALPSLACRPARPPHALPAPLLALAQPLCCPTLTGKCRTSSPAATWTRCCPQRPPKSCSRSSAR